MKITVMSLFRDSESYLSKTLKSLDNLREIPNIDWEFIFYENDSVDTTLSSLSTWLQNKEGRVYSEKLGFPKFGSVTDLQRLVYLSYYRNRLLSSAGNFRSAFTLLLDSDIEFDNSHFETMHEKLRDHRDFVMLTPNTREPRMNDMMFGETKDCYYDVFALRDKYFNNGLYFTDCPLPLQEDRDAWKTNEVVEVGSAFGGFALIKTDVLKKCKWSTCKDSEHVNFCSELRSFGRIGIVPSCKPKAYADLSKVNLQACQQIAQQQIPFIQQINNVFDSSRGVLV